MFMSVDFIRLSFISELKLLDVFMRLGLLLDRFSFNELIKLLSVDESEFDELKRDADGEPPFGSSWFKIECC